MPDLGSPKVEYGLAIYIHHIKVKSYLFNMYLDIYKEFKKHVDCK